MSTLIALPWSSPKSFYDVIDYPGLKECNIIVSRHELKLADAGDEMMQEVLCDRYAATIGREGLEVNWYVLRKHMVHAGSVPRPTMGLGAMVRSLKLKLTNV